jgi:PII-like signaling protein
MNQDCLKLTTYFGERDRTARVPLAADLIELYGNLGLRTSVLLRGADGFGPLHHLHAEGMLSLSEDLPVVSVAVDARSRIEAALERVLEIQRRGLITLERAELLSGSAPSAEELAKQPGEAIKLTVYVGRQQRVGRVPADVAICDLLHRNGMAGAIVLLGVDGTRAGRRFRARFIGRNADVPLLIVALGTGERVTAVLPELARLLPEALMTVEPVRLCKRDGERLSERQLFEGSDEHGLEWWQKLTVYSSHHASHGDYPLHLAIARRLRESAAAGVTCLRGIWGFHGDHAPHGDGLFQLERHVPVCTITIDRPEQIARSFEVIDELTQAHGLVTSEMVAATSAAVGDGRHRTLRLPD